MPETGTLVFFTCAVIGGACIYLWQRHHSRITKTLNTLDLQDLDDIELLQAIEKTFDITIENREAETLTTLGQLHVLVSKKIETHSDFDPVWALLCQIAREHSGTPDPIDKDTTFFSQLAKQRKR